MFAFNRSALAVVLPLALLVAVVLFSNLEPDASTLRAQTDHTDHAVAANLPSR